MTKLKLNLVELETNRFYSAFHPVLSNMSAQIVGNNALTGVAINGFWVEASDVDQLNSAQFQVTNIIRLRHRIQPPDLDDFRTINQVDIINTFTSVVGSLTLLVGAIAGISLVVGALALLILCWFRSWNERVKSVFAKPWVQPVQTF
jgi:ABC-type antimicrobial peptide transport system permease subunit